MKKAAMRLTFRVVVAGLLRKGSREILLGEGDVESANEVIHGGVDGLA